MRGTNKKGEFHFWLESEDFVIDLTAHQFEGFDKPFLLISKSEYPLYKVFNKDIQEKEIHPNWPGLEKISSHIQKRFYAEYY
ncbi:hypothetical protein ACFSX8_03980 [Acinetobacter gyllenbergii]|nr:hypothetical protein L293_0304 [Acinetobacter gyllenbergii CIP 110306 = MTCC 11365]